MTTTFPVVKGCLLSSKHYTWNTADSLGKGASAVVYLGRRKETGLVVAVKSFHKNFLSSSSRNGDLRELELLKQLDHPNIIKLLDIQFEESSHNPVLVMEYCEGGSLHHMLEQPQYHYGLSEQEYMLVLTNVADGMAYLRRENIIHRDIKPGNIMRFVTDEGNSVYKLTDFGAARNLCEEEEFQSLYGTEEYLHPGVYETAVLRMSPGRSFDAKVDLWSLGVTFYHAATGQLPFRPYGGRNNRQTMFQIISGKESGVISGVQKTSNGPVEWHRELPETCPLSSGLKCLVTPILSGLMEYDHTRMITYDTFFHIVNVIKRKITITIFHFAAAQEIVVYADREWLYADLQDSIASQFDISAPDQIILVDGKRLDSVVDLMLKIEDYPPRLLDSVLYLFQTSPRDLSCLRDPEISPFPDLSTFVGMDGDAKNAAACSSIGELINRYALTVSKRQDLIINGIACLRIYVESLHESSQDKMMLMHRLLYDFESHLQTFFKMIDIFKDNLRSASIEFVTILNDIKNDSIVRPVFGKAKERLSEIERYRNNVSIRLDDIKDKSAKLISDCKTKKCCQRIAHHLSVVVSIQNRFRRDKGVRHQMTTHDENIHHFERQKLDKHCQAMRSILVTHCFQHQAKLYQDAIRVADFSIRSLNHVNKIDDNITSVLNCQKLLTDKILKMRQSVMAQPICDSGFCSDLAESCASENIDVTTNSVSVSSVATDRSNVSDLAKKLSDLKGELEENTKLFSTMESPPSSVLPEIDKKPILNGACVMTDPG